MNVTVQACHCTLIEQDETCPVGYPSLLCDDCDGRGVVASPPMQETFQQEVDRWLIACFGEEIARDKIERNHRFLEEALELVQAGGCTASEAHQLVDYVYGRPVGEMPQEVGGVMNTLAALCLAYGLDMVECGNVEIARCWTKVEKIRAKQAAKPKHSPLPELVASPSRREEVIQECISVVESFHHSAHLGEVLAALRALQSG